MTAVACGRSVMDPFTGAWVANIITRTLIRAALFARRDLLHFVPLVYQRLIPE